MPAPTLSRAERFGSAAYGAKRAQPGTRSSQAWTSSVVVPSEPEAPTEIFVGTLERLAIYTDWGVGSVWSEERKSVRVTGKSLVDLVEGAEYEFRGRPKHHAVHGEGFEVAVATPYIHPNRKSIVKYLVRSFKGVTELKAKKFVDAITLASPEEEGVALEKLRQQLLTAPWTVDLTVVSKKAEFKMDEEASPMLAFVHRDFSTKLVGIPGMRENVLKALASYILQGEASKHLDEEHAQQQSQALDPRVIERCWASLIRDPYEPISAVPGYSFGTADAIGASVNIPRDEPVRLKALVVYALDQGCTRWGHTYLTGRQFREAISHVDHRISAEQAIEYGLEAGLIELDDQFGEARYYTPDLLAAETSLAQRIHAMCEDDEPLVKASREQVQARIKDITRQVAPHLTNGLDQSQLDALTGIMTSRKRLHTLTAGPGCGKTALMEILSAVLKSRDFVFCGPTGKSAKVLHNRLSKHGRSAATVHSTLQGGSRKDFQFNEENPLEGDILVLDEGGMADNDLADGIMGAACNMHVIVLGDPDQLPSVGPGTFLKELLSLSGPDHHRLNTTHRNSGGILEVIEQVRQGTIDCVDRPAVRFSHHLGEAQDQFPRVAQQYVSAVSRRGFENVILLIPKRQGEPSVPGWNITYANAVLRDMCNPGAEKIPGSARFHVGDRIIIRANMEVPAAGAEPRRSSRNSYSDGEGDAPQVRVVNGDTGTIQGYELYQAKAGKPRQAGARCLRLKLDDGRMVDFPGSAPDLLQHSYALTVHSGMGSEYEHVIMVAPPATRSFNNRAMLFTGLSRARGMLEVHGEDSDLRRIAATLPARRNSALAQRVRRLSGQADVAVDDGDDWDTEEGDERASTAAVATSPRARRYAMGVERA